jgi:hypothetical protein
MAGPLRPLDTPAIGEGGRQTGNQDVPVIAGAVATRMKGDLGKDLLAFEGIDDEIHGGAVG